MEIRQGVNRRRKKRNGFLAYFKRNFHFNFAFIGITVASVNLIVMDQLHRGKNHPNHEVLRDGFMQEFTSHNITQQQQKTGPEEIGEKHTTLQEKGEKNTTPQRPTNSQQEMGEKNEINKGQAFVSREEDNSIEKLANSAESAAQTIREESRPRLGVQQRSIGHFPKGNSTEEGKFQVTFPWKPLYNVLLGPWESIRGGDTDADYGGLHFESIKRASSFERQIRTSDTEENEMRREEVLEKVDTKPPILEQYDNDPPFNSSNPCRRPAWTNLMFPTCNTLHEVPYDRPAGDGYQNFHYNAVGEGTFRQTFVFRELEVEGARLKVGGETFALKELLYSIFSRRFLENQLYIIPYEALILERLTFSDHIANIYAYCGGTSILETLPEEVNTIIQPGDGRANHTRLLAMDRVKSKNDLSPEEKVSIALEMAEAIADLHGYRDGVIVHGDNHIDQFLFDEYGYVKLGDFNIATILQWNEEKGEYCRNKREPWAYPFRAPEEIGGVPFDEMIDVFTMGNNIYSLVTGLRPFYDIRKAKEICAKILNGERGFIDPRYRTRYVDAQLLRLVDRCWQHKAEDRIDIFTLVQKLQRLGDTLGFINYEV